MELIKKNKKKVIIAFIILLIALLIPKIHDFFVYTTLVEAEPKALNLFFENETNFMLKDLSVSVGDIVMIDEMNFKKNKELARYVKEWDYAKPQDLILRYKNGNGEEKEYFIKTIELSESTQYIRINVMDVDKYGINKISLSSNRDDGEIIVFEN